MHSGDGGNFTSVQLRSKQFCILDDGRSNFLPVTSGKVESTNFHDFVFAKTLGGEGPWRQKRGGKYLSYIPFIL